ADGPAAPDLVADVSPRALRATQRVSTRKTALPSLGTTSRRELVHLLVNGLDHCPRVFKRILRVGAKRVDCTASRAGKVVSGGLELRPGLAFSARHLRHGGQLVKRRQCAPPGVSARCEIHVRQVCCPGLSSNLGEARRPSVPDTVESRTLVALCEQRRSLVNHRVALTNRLTSLLKQYFPQALEWVGDLPSGQACDFLTRWPTLAAVQRARPSTLRQFYRVHNCRKAEVIEARLAAIANARALTTDAAVIQ